VNHQQIMLTMLRATPTLVTDDLLRRNGVRHPDMAACRLRQHGHRIERVRAFGYILRKSENSS
jgi:hypothetical protein